MNVLVVSFNLLLIDFYIFYPLTVGIFCVLLIIKLSLNSFGFIAYKVVFFLFILYRLFNPNDYNVLR